jgi:hypothetical protein
VLLLRESVQQKLGFDTAPPEGERFSASGFAAANGSLPSITILISRPGRRRHTGTDAPSETA